LILRGLPFPCLGNHDPLVFPSLFGDFLNRFFIVPNSTLYFGLRARLMVGFRPSLTPFFLRPSAFQNVRFLPFRSLVIFRRYTSCPTWPLPPSPFRFFDPAVLSPLSLSSFFFSRGERPSFPPNTSSILVSRATLGSGQTGTPSPSASFCFSFPATFCFTPGFLLEGDPIRPLPFLPSLGKYARANPCPVYEFLPRL